MRTAAIRIGLALACVSCTEREAPPGTSTVVRGDTVIISGDPEGADFRIALKRLTRLGSDEDPVSPDEGAYVVPTADGRFFVSRVVGAVGIAEYDSAGRFVQLHGRRGEGPGEYVAIIHSMARARGDTLVVYDSRARKFSFLDGTGQFVFSLHAPFRVSDFSIMADGTIAATGAYSSGDHTPWELGPSLHVISRDGNIIRSLGDSLGPMRPHQAVRQVRTVAVSPTGVLAVAKRLKYEITVEFPDGRRRIILRRVPWFAPSDSAPIHQPQITKIWFDEDGRLWANVLTRNVRELSQEAYRSAEAHLQTVQFVTEVFDIMEGRLLLSERLEEPTLFYGGLAVTPVSLASGNLTLDVSIPTITTTRR